MIYLIVAALSVLVTATGVLFILGKPMDRKIIVVLVICGLLLLFIGWKIASEGAHKQCGSNDFGDVAECK